MQHNHNKSVRIPRNHTSGSCEVHRHIAEKALPKTMPRNEIKHAARVLSRYRDARLTRILRIRLRLTVRVKKPVKSPGYPEIFHRFFQLFFFCAVGTYSRLPLRLLCRSPRPRLCSTEPVSQRDKTRCASFISLSRRSPPPNPCSGFNMPGQVRSGSFHSILSCSSADGREFGLSDGSEHFPVPSAPPASPQRYTALSEERS